MKAFALWAAIAVAGYAGLGLGSHFTRSVAGERVLIAVDVSGSLEESKYKLPQALAFLQARRYARFKVVTNSSNNSLREIQDWSSHIDFEAVSRINMYAPLELKKLLEFDEVRSADLVIFVTNAPDTRALAGVPNSRIVRVE